MLRGFTRATGNSSSANRSSNLRSYPPLASSTTHSGEKRLIVLTSRVIPRRSFGTISFSPPGLNATSSRSFETSTPTKTPRVIFSSSAQPTLARYGLTVRATVRACTFKNATATTQAKLSLGLFRTRSAHGLSQPTLWQPAHLSTHPLHRQAIRLRLAAIGVVGQRKESWPASADRRGFASQNLKPPISPPPGIFPSASKFYERPRGKMLTMSLSLDTRAARKKVAR